MKKQIDLITKIWAVREVVHLLLATGAVSMCLWFLHQMKERWI